ncbi:MAG: Asp-tRNA(Asn)/Glu-tRNA(Gln) amidotransferase subunit GatC [Synergistaceae bacterium]|nr:Asp-tRNA(Asn)/Glu-tRNA(Gln) amidotransferase subunit GatC [Synergistaceae bacterium]
MILTSEQVNEIALESRLLLTEQELAGATRYINNFLKVLDSFRELDLKDVEPFSFAEAIECPLRDDKVIPFADTEAILHESAHVDGSYFKVPRIMEGE